MTEIAYGPLPEHRFDYHSPPPASSPAPPQPQLLVFVHGGAWRSEDKADHAPLARTLARLTGWPVAPVQHPAHAEDVLRALHFLTTWPAPGCAAPAQQLVLLGHSCSAHILTSILLDQASAPSLTPAPPLLAATRAVVLSEGIYDLDALLRSFPDYKAWFVAAAFGDRDAYPDANTAAHPLRPARRTEAIHAHLVDVAGADRVQKSWTRWTRATMSC
ncbi:Alpha/Beta hydrolase protein [Epithele typhae]|uniref:Alpha/Beta hydrolase protein n=1 Tax=Epithele typhae TaxID=378194 RepID=UPI0020084B7E|nr:Alpha/Beta hydrolase protein [Epithele typhae]KAH9946002.1 Alpha/Beta hydrolase protein [Epithele typhae]